jgi:hypothetical protein
MQELSRDLTFDSDNNRFLRTIVYGMSIDEFNSEVQRTQAQIAVANMNVQELQKRSDALDTLQADPTISAAIQGRKLELGKPDPAEQMPVNGG